MRNWLTIHMSTIKVQIFTLCSWLSCQTFHRKFSATRGSNARWRMQNILKACASAPVIRAVRGTRLARSTSVLRLIECSEILDIKLFTTAQERIRNRLC